MPGDVGYLRKSRKDMELGLSDEEILARHRAEILSNAKRLGRNIVEFYSEGVISGDSIAERPVMQRLLREVEAGRWDAVHVVEVARLARGDSMDQGLVSRAFRYSHTLIITPGKTFDPSSDSDETYFDLDLFFSRWEYKTIKSRLSRGRLASVHEGKWAANRSPYGYTRVKLSGEKGWTLSPTPNADVVRSMFRWYVHGPDGGAPIGVSLIVRRLNELGIPSPSGRDWTNCTVRDILANPVYAGFIRWGNRPSVRSVRDGQISISTPRADPSALELFPGRHPALIPEALYRAAARKLRANPSRPGPKQVAMKNPLSGLVYCTGCGRAMVRRPYSSGRVESLLCPYTSCGMVSSDLAAVEAAILRALRHWLDDFELARREDPDPSGELSVLDASIRSARSDLAGLSTQLSRAYDLVEQGVYSTEVFLQRSRENAERRAAAEARLDSLTAEVQKKRAAIAAREQIAPNIRHVLVSYPTATSPEEKNALLRSVLDRVDYKKTTRERYRGGSDLSVTITPRIPT